MPCDLRASVGPGKENLLEDVGTVQFFLGLVGTVAGGTVSLDVDGIFGSNTEAAIRRFQAAQQFVFVDGIVDPGDVTMKRLQLFAMKDSSFSFAVARNVIVGATRHEDPVEDVQLERPGADGVGIVAEAITRRIYSHPEHGTWEVEGDLLEAYKAQLEEGGDLGYPVSNFRRMPNGGFVNYFEHGRIIMNPNELAVPEFLPF